MTANNGLRGQLEVGKCKNRWKVGKIIHANVHGYYPTSQLLSSIMRRILRKPILQMLRSFTEVLEYRSDSACLSCCLAAVHTINLDTIRDQ